MVAPLLAYVHAIVVLLPLADSVNPAAKSAPLLSCSSPQRTACEPPTVVPLLAETLSLATASNATVIENCSFSNVTNKTTPQKRSKNGLD